MKTKKQISRKVNYETWLIWYDLFSEMKFGTKVSKDLLKNMVYQEVKFHEVSPTTKVMLNVFINQVDFDEIANTINNEQKEK